MKLKKQEHEEEAGEAWLLPYSDLMTLLLAVFIVLFAVSSMDSEKAAEIAKAFRDGMLTGSSGILDDGGISIIPDGSSSGDGLTQQEIDAMIDPQDLANLKEIKVALESYFKDEGINQSISSYIDERGLVISLNNMILFDLGSAVIKPDNEGLLLTIAEKVKDMDNYVRIEGHTDNLPISTDKYPSNWELSSSRSIQVVQLFVNKAGIDPERMVAVGYGEYKPIADNNTEEGRAKNRRVDIIILNTKYNSLEDQLSDVPHIN